ncbi:ubiquitin carboxyl-terminal hydrolase [Ceratobasidium sp. AG-Ba]|nr:ubiquitin carboxyl-terminal hydrolase [Ceratobasidium sp. AG-Ba]
MPVPNGHGLLPLGLGDGGSSDPSDHSPVRPGNDLQGSSDIATTDSSSSEADEAEEYPPSQQPIEYTQESQDITDDSDCPHLRMRVVDPGFLRMYSSAVSWNTRNRMQGEAGKRKRSKASVVRCSDCAVPLARPCVCVECSTAGCLLSNHIIDHLRFMGHAFFVDLASGSIYCAECDDFVYSSRLDQAYALAMLSAEEQVARFKLTSSSRQQFRPWIPNPQTSSELLKATQVQCSGLRGLYNLGSTCYLNVIVQMMIHNPLVRNYYMSDKHNNQQCAIKECMSCEMDKLFTKVYSSDPGPLGPTTILHSLWLNSTDLASFGQHDAHECFISILNQIHKTSSGSDTTPCTCLVHSTFAGQLQSDVQCGQCENVTSISEMMLDISLDLKPIAAGGLDMTLLSCLKRFTQPEKTTYKCEKCGNSSNDATKQLSVRKLPPVLCIQLKRFEHGASSSNKIETVVRFGATLNMAPFSTVMARKGGNKHPGPDSMYEYDLLAVVNHEGQMDTGHYTNFARCHDRWYRFDDEKVTRSSLQECLRSSAYMLVYVKRHLSYRASDELPMLPDDGELLAGMEGVDPVFMDLVNTATQDDSELLQLFGDA